MAPLLILNVSSLTISSLLLCLVLCRHESWAAQQSGSIPVVEATCGDCWCKPDNNSNEECAKLTKGIQQTFSNSVIELYASFILTGTPITMATITNDNNNEPCFPFSTGSIDNFPESNLPQCVLPSTSETSICTHVFEDENMDFASVTECKARRYELKTFTTTATDTTIPPNASIVHQGACGVCSTAQDLSVKMRTNLDLNEIGFKCGTSYFLDPNRQLEQLASCFQQQTGLMLQQQQEAAGDDSTGFTKPCAQAWAYYTATNAFTCGNVCLGQTPPFSSPAPDCVADKCIQCGSKVSQEFNALAGIGAFTPNAGIVDYNIALPCNSFYRVIHDPCPGQSLEGATVPTTFEPTRPPSSSSSSACCIGGRMMSVVWMLLLLAERCF